MTVSTDGGVVEYRGYRISDFAKASSRKFLRKQSLDFTDEHERTVYLRFLENATVLVDACESVIDEFDVRATLANEVRYVHGGLPLAVSANHGIPAYSHDMGFLDQTVIFGRPSNRNAQPQFSDRATVERHLQEPLREEQRQYIRSLLERRASGEETVFRYSSQSSRSIPASWKSESGRTVAGMFTNLIWDASLEIDEDEYPFPDVLEWITATIGYLSDREDVLLVIKTHPAEQVMGTNESVSEWVRRRHEPLPENVFLLEPDTEVNTYELFEDLDVGLVYNSTVGIEMAYRGVPVVVAGDTHYRGFDFTHDPRTKREYERILDRLDDLPTIPEMRTLARRYAYFSFVEQGIDFPYVSANGSFTEFEYPPVRHDELTPGNEPFDIVVESILADEPVIQPWSSGRIESDERVTK